MSEQIREQISAFLDGELPSSESELLLKRLARDPALRESFGRYAFIGEAMRGASPVFLRKDFQARVGLAINGEAAPTSSAVAGRGSARWWRPFAGAAVVAGVAAIAVVALEERAIVPAARPALVASVQSPVKGPPQQASAAREPLSYTVPAAPHEARAGVLPARLAGYVFAHSRYSSGLDQRGVLADLLIDADESQAAAKEVVTRDAP